MGKNYSPCIDVCKYRDDGHCIGCSMTKIQKKISKSLKSKDKQLAFLELIRMQQNLLGGFETWERAHKQRYSGKD